jgi:hypothetical protein
VPPPDDGELTGLGFAGSGGFDPPAPSPPEEGFFGDGGDGAGPPPPPPGPPPGSIGTNPAGTDSATGRNPSTTIEPLPMTSANTNTSAQVAVALNLNTARTHARAAIVTIPPGNHIAISVRFDIYTIDRDGTRRFLKLTQPQPTQRRATETEC